MLPVWDWKGFRSGNSELSEEEFVTSFQNPIFIVFSKMSDSPFGQLIDSFAFDMSQQKATMTDMPLNPGSTTTSVQIYELKFDSAWEDPLRIRIGRDEGNELCLKFENISKKHAEIRKTVDGDLFIVDTNSSNGTTLAGKALEPNIPQKLSENQKIVFSKRIVGFLASPQLLYKMMKIG